MPKKPINSEGKVLPTPRQRYIYDKIVLFIEKYQVPPTIRDLCQITGIKSPNGIVTHIDALVKKGYIRHEAYASRTIVLVDPPRCPYCGKE